MPNEQVVTPYRAINIFSESVLYPFFMKALQTDQSLSELSLAKRVEGGSDSYQDAMDMLIVTLQQKDSPESPGWSVKQANAYIEKIINAVEARRGAYKIKNSEAKTAETNKEEWEHMQVDIANIFENIHKIPENVKDFEDKKPLAFSNSSFIDRNRNVIIAGSLAVLALIAGLAIILSGPGLAGLIVAIPLLIVSIPATLLCAASVLGKEREYSLAAHDTRREVVLEKNTPAEPRGSTYVTVAEKLANSNPTPTRSPENTPAPPVQSFTASPPSAEGSLIESRSEGSSVTHNKSI